MALLWAIARMLRGEWHCQCGSRLSFLPLTVTIEGFSATFHKPPFCRDCTVLRLQQILTLCVTCERPIWPTEYVATGYVGTKQLEHRGRRCTMAHAYPQCSADYLATGKIRWDGTINSNAEEIF